MKMQSWQNLPILRFLSGFWGWLAIIIFSWDFFAQQLDRGAITAVAIIYGTILGLYAGSKEYTRWSEKNSYKSRYAGEIYIIIWSLLIAFFVIMSLFFPGRYNIPGEFPAVYLTVLSIFILSRQSRYLKIQK